MSHFAQPIARSHRDRSWRGNGAIRAPRWPLRRPSIEVRNPCCCISEGIDRALFNWGLKMRPISRGRISPLLLFALLTVPRAAVSSEDCDAFEDPTMRLGCEMREQLKPTFDEDGTASFPNWTVLQRKSAMTDANDVFLSVDSKEKISCNFDAAPKPVSLQIRCLDNSTAIILSTHCHLASGFGPYGEIQYRVDKNPPKTRNFSSTTSNDSLMREGYGRSGSIIRELFDSEQLLVRFTPFNDSPKEARFDVSGLRSAITPLRKSCGW